MNVLMCIFIPSLFSVYLYEQIEGKMLTNKDFIIYYLNYTLCNNMIVAFICRFIYGLTTSIEEHIHNFPMFAFKYVIISTIIAGLLPVVYLFLKKNINIKIFIKKEHKNEKNHKNK